jgi:hypothetical protein
MKMSKIVQVKTPLELQEFLWKDGALVRAEDAKVPPPEKTDFLNLRDWGMQDVTEPDLHPGLKVTPFPVVGTFVSWEMRRQ